MRKNFDIPLIRSRLEGKTGKKYWRSLEEIAETDAFQDFLKHEFPQGADQWLNEVSRRNFIKLMAASLALGGLTSCASTPSEKIVPYVRAPEEIVPGKPLFFATAMPLFAGAAMPLLAESHMGRPTKLDGNPDHPASLGKSDAFLQASVLNLYDPDRAQIITQAGLLTSWNAFVESLGRELDAQRANNGAGIRILTETITSPSLVSLLEDVLSEFPEARWIQYEPINRDSAREGAIMAFGEDVNPVYRFDQAEVVVSLDSNFTQFGAGSVRYAQDFTDKRRVREDNLAMNRMYMVETVPSATGTLADHRLPLSTAQIEAFALALASELGVGVDAPAADSLTDVPEGWLTAIAEDLQANAGQSIVIAGETQPPLVHALAHAMNEALGNVDQTVIYTDPLEGNSTNQTEDLRVLSDDMDNGRVDVLLIIEANPVYNAPADVNFVDTIRQVPYRAKMGMYIDETAALCEWNVPMSHYLESWFDARAYDGTVTLTQPLVNPLYDSRSPHQMVGAIIGQSVSSDYDLIREYWTDEVSTGDFEAFWEESLHDGFMADTALPTKSVSASTAEMTATPIEGSGLELNFRPDPTIWDGRFANNGWLQELPKPITKLTWENVAAISPSTAEELGLTNGDVVELSYRGRSVEAPIWVFPGQAKNTVAISLGYGRTVAGRVGTGMGFSAYSLQNSDARWFEPGVELSRVRQGYQLASTQMHYNMEGRYPVRAGTVQHFEEDPEFVEHIVDHGPFNDDDSLMPGWDYDSYAWGMVVDLSACNGCNACVVACQAENNIPIVGKEEVIRGREMHWIRVDSYFEGELDNPAAYHQPMMCQHCEQAPCELVCPVAATVHDAEGLNVMVYNRCVGTRYCSNNCPYKVRRFNFFDYGDQTSESLKGQRNPDVTVRIRGIMEKCTYCIQRISGARIQAKVENRRIEDGEVVTACQSACPTKAIYFGDTNDPNSEVSRMKAQHLNYGILTEFGTRPRTSYLAKLRNPNDALEDPIPHKGDHGEDHGESHEEDHG